MYVLEIMIMLSVILYLGFYCYVILIFILDFVRYFDSRFSDSICYKVIKILELNYSYYKEYLKILVNVYLWIMY